MILDDDKGCIAFFSSPYAGRDDSVADLFPVKLYE